MTQDQEPPTLTASQRADRDLVVAALRKREAGVVPTERELRALRKIEREREENLRWQYYATVPKKHYLAMAGKPDRPRAAKVILEQADRYGLPLAGATLDLREVIRSFHDFLAENAVKLAGPDTDDVLCASGGTSLWLEKLREERARLAGLQRREKEHSLLARDLVHQGCIRIASTLKQTGEALGRQCGEEARQILDEGLEDAQREIDRFFGNGDVHLQGGGEPEAVIGADQVAEARPKKRTAAQRGKRRSNQGKSAKVRSAKARRRQPKKQAD